MKVLENKTVDSKREMDILDALQDIRARNARNERVGHSQSDDMLSRLALEEVETEEETLRKRLEEEDEKLVREVFSKIPMASGSGTSVVTVKRKADDKEPPAHTLLSSSARALIATTAVAPAVKKRKTDGKNLLGIKVVKKANKASAS
jgi:hypothetical protein